jgi:hypothetical protein
MIQTPYTEVRNPAYNRYKSIDCEINHVSMGWIPFTASSEDTEEYGRKLFTDLQAELYGPVATWPVENIRQEQKQLIAEQRYKVETGGITVEGVAVNTERDVRTLVFEAAWNATSDPTFTYNWKIPGGIFITLSSEQVINIGKAVAAHIQSCFDQEAVLCAAVDEGTYLDSMLLLGWPINS